jgi:hypothetical protein
VETVEGRALDESQERKDGEQADVLCRRHIPLRVGSLRRRGEDQEGGFEEDGNGFIEPGTAEDPVGRAGNGEAREGSGEGQRAATESMDRSTRRSRCVAEQP